MSKQAPIFRPISAPLDVSDEALNAIGDKLGVPTMVKPEPPAPPYAAAAAKPSPSAIAEASQAVQETLKAISASRVEEKAPSPQEKLTVELPAYLMREMRRDCADKRVTQRYLVLQGLKALGYGIEPDDLVPDHRRQQGKAGKA